MASWITEFRVCMDTAKAAGARAPDPDILDQMRERVRAKREGLTPAPS